MSTYVIINITDKHIPKKRYKVFFKQNGQLKKLLNDADKK